MVFIAREEHRGKTVKEILKQELKLSGSMIKHIKFLDDGIMLNSKKVTVRAVMQTGDVLKINTEDSPQKREIEAVDLPLNIVYEDSDITVPDKPPYMPTHPSHGHFDDTVANALAYRYKDENKPFVFRPVNRLDRNTSGLLIVARNRIAASELSKSMAQKKIHKKYIAVLDGELKCDSGSIETYMRRSEKSIIVREICEKCEGADYALTNYKVLLKSGGHTVVVAEPVTGRTHQLRVHFASLGCPIVGDGLYGSESELISRHALHAAKITFPHPKDGREMSFCAGLHEDMTALLEKLFSQEELENVFKK